MADAAKPGMTTQQKVGLGLGIAAALGGVVLAASKFGGGDDEKKPAKLENPFAGIRKRLGRKSCGGCGLDKSEE